MTMKKLTLAMVIVASLLSGCANTNTSTEFSAKAQQLNMQVTNIKLFDRVMVSENKPVNDAKTLYVAPLDLSNVKVKENFRRSASIHHKWELTGKDIRSFQSYFEKAMSKQFGVESDYVIVTDPEHATVRIEPKLTQISPNAPKDDFSSREHRVDYYSAGSGSLSIEIDVSLNGELIYKVEDTRDAGSFWEKNDRLSSRKNVKNLFNAWAKNLVDLVQKG
jgi:hypothetical protein